ncbi:MAG TPA: vWA domain-containing protein, partial [Yinghuangia sp.]|nr:vWA domain-containing protein [Yinghuangia sp.]
RWSVRYRRKLAAALRHAWGARRVGILRSILVRERAGEELEPKELRLLAAEIDRFAQGRSRAVVHECVAFVLGAPGPYTRPLLRAYTDARTDFDAGRVLPYETLEGLRGRFHPNEPAARVLELTKSRLTAGQRLAKQEQAERAGVEVDVDFTRYDAVRLYLYAFRRGMTDEVARALASRARQAAASLDLGYRNVALLLDGSASMAGADEQALRPIAVTLALRDAFRAAGGGNADSSVTETWFGGRPDNGGLVHPAGATAPAEALIEVLAQGPDIVVVVSDGYENAPAGRFAETLAAVRGFGIRTPVVQLAPVLAAESGGVRPLADEVPVAALQRLEGLELLACRLVLDAEPEVGLRMLDRIAAAGGEPGRREVGAADVGDDSRSVPAAVPRSVFEAMPENPSESAPEEVSS